LFALISRLMSAVTSRIRLALLAPCAALVLASVFAISAQDAKTVPQPASAPAPQSRPAPAPHPSAASAQPVPSAEVPAITEEEIRTLLVGKQLFLRGGYLDNTLSFNERGALVGHSPQGSYTLCDIQIDKVHLSKHKLELDGQRYGLHFLGALPYEDPTKAVDRVNITPKKKFVKITIDREIVVKPKQPKEKKDKNKSGPLTAKPAASSATSTASAPPSATSTASEAQAEIAAAPPAERPADAKSLTTTTSQAHANAVLKEALSNVFAQGFDSRMMDAMPSFWKLYYQAAANKTDYRPTDPSVLRDNMVDQKARLLSNFEPQSNQYAQDHGIAGMSLYHVVVGADGKPAEIAVARPIGFGLDENAVDAIRKATFAPALKDGRPVPVLLDLVVQFRIYSKMTNVVDKQPGQSTKPVLPGPYSVEH
jgi:outer membrane biosynthesis protein TonB